MDKEMTGYFLQTKKFYNEAHANAFLKDIDASLVKDIIRNIDTYIKDSYTIDGDPIIRYNSMEAIVINYYQTKEE